MKEKYLNGPSMKKHMSNYQSAINHVIYSFVFFASLLMSWSYAEAADLENIEIGSPSNDVVKITVGLSEQIAEPKIFSTDDPARIIVDLVGVNNKLPERTKQINIGLTESISVIEVGDRTRLIINMIDKSSYTLTQENNNLILIVDSHSSVTKNKRESAMGLAEVTGIDFRRGEKGEARFIINTSESSTTADIYEDKGDIVINLTNTSIPKELKRNFDVLDFATPVSFIQTNENGEFVSFTMETNSPSEYMSYQSAQQIIVEVKPIDEKTADQDKFGYSGEKLSLNFQNIEVRAVLQLLADFTDMNLVTSDTVQGNLTLRLKNVPWDQALDIILKSKGLAMRQSGNVMMVAPVAEITAREKQELDAQKQQVRLEPVYTEVLEINFASASDMMKLLETSGKGSNSGAGSSGFLSERGSISLDERTNSLIIRDTKQNIEAVKSVIDELDKPVRQVLIESRIVIANDDFDKELGVRFGASKYGTSNSKYITDYAVSGQLDQAENLIDGEALEYPNHLNVDLPAANPTGSIGLALAKLPFGLSLELELSAMQAEGRGEIISTPKVITANKKQATIEQGTEIPYQEASSSGATSVSFKEAVLKLDVTPQITPEDQVIMDLEVSQDQVGTVFQNVPSIDTRSVETQVIVDNGETVVLGGIYEQTKTDSLEKVPFFGDLPYVGFLFRTSSNSDSKRELLIFVTPKIVKEGLQY
jgi:type IV pilus assembly protein PilQ